MESWPRFHAREPGLALPTCGGLPRLIENREVTHASFLPGARGGVQGRSCFSTVVPSRAFKSANCYQPRRLCWWVGAQRAPRLGRWCHWVVPDGGRRVSPCPSKPPSLAPILQLSLTLRLLPPQCPLRASVSHGSQEGAGTSPVIPSHSLSASALTGIPLSELVSALGVGTQGSAHHHGLCRETLSLTAQLSPAVGSLPQRKPGLGNGFPPPKYTPAPPPPPTRPTSLLSPKGRGLPYAQRAPTLEPFMPNPGPRPAWGPALAL